jgi:hypothetical protein
MNRKAMLVVAICLFSFLALPVVAAYSGTFYPPYTYATEFASQGQGLGIITTDGQESGWGYATGYLFDYVSVWTAWPWVLYSNRNGGCYVFQEWTAPAASSSITLKACLKLYFFAYKTADIGAYAKVAVRLRIQEYTGVVWCDKDSKEVYAEYATVAGKTVSGDMIWPTFTSNKPIYQYYAYRVVVDFVVDAQVYYPNSAFIQFSSSYPYGARCQVVWMGYQY